MKKLKKHSFVALVFLSIMFYQVKSQTYENGLNVSASDQVINKNPVFNDLKPQNEILAKRDRNGKHFLNSDGSITAVVSSGSTHYLAGNFWQEIDNDIILNNSGYFSLYTYISLKNSYKSYYPGRSKFNGILTQLNEGIMKEFLNPGKYWITDEGSTEIQEINSTIGSVNENTITYLNSYKYTDIRFTQENDRRKLDIILNDRNALKGAPANARAIAFIETIEIPSGWKLVHENNEINIFTSKGDWVVSYPQPKIYEQNPRPSNKDYSEISGQFLVEQNGNRYMISTIVPLDWLLDKDRSYPIVVDPTTDFYPSNATWWTASTYNCCNFTNGLLHLDADGGGTGDDFCYAKFNLSSINPGAVPTVASVYTYVYAGSNNQVYLTHTNGIDPVASHGSALYYAIQSSSNRISSAYSWSVGWKSQAFNASGINRLYTTDISNGWTAVGFYSPINGDGYARPYNHTDKPYIRLTYTIDSFDIDITSIKSPIIPTVGNNTVTVSLTNYGSIPVTQDVVLQYNINGGSWVSDTLHITSPWNTRVKKQFTFSQLWNITTAGTYNLCVKIDPQISGDPDASDQICISKCTGLMGNYTIGSTGNYSTFTNAISDLMACGVSGPVTFNIQPGIYNDRIILPEINGSSSFNRITFNGNSKTNVKLTYQGVTSSNRATVILNGADYITFKNMTIENTGSSYALAVLFKSQADYNIILNCKIEVNATSTVNWIQGLLASNSESSQNGTGNNANNNLIENNEIIGGYYGVYFLGTSASILCSGNKLVSNTFLGQYYFALQMQFQMGEVIQYNKIIIGQRNNQAVGIYNYQCQKSIIDGNIIQPGRYGIQTYYENNYSIGDSTMIINNIINNFKNNLYNTGIYAEFYNYNLRVYHNTIIVDGSSSSYQNSAIHFFRYPYFSVIKNNILKSTNYSLLISLFLPRANEIDFNDYIYQGAPGNKFYNSHQGYYSNLTSWKTSTINLVNPHDLNSFDNSNPHFISSSDFHLNSTYPPLRGFVSSVTHDVDGDLRCPYESTLGADETGYPQSPPTAGFTLPFNASDTICFGTPVVFTNVYGKNDPAGHWWYLNSVFQTNDLNWNYTFPQPSFDTIKLITATCGGLDTFTKIVVVDTPALAPVADFFTDVNIIETYFPVYLNDVSVNCPSNWKWVIEPDSILVSGSFLMPTITFLPADPSNPWAIPTNDTMQNVVLSFDYPGSYKICLTAKNARGSNTICKIDYVTVIARQDMCQYVFPEVEKSMYGTLFDDGGEFANYSIGQNNPPCELKLDPCANTLALTFWEFDVRSGDYLRIYEGTDNTGTPVWNVSQHPNGLGNNMNMSSQYFDTTYVSTTGKMFIEWETDNTVTGPGFAANWRATKGNFQPPVAAFSSPDSICVGSLVNFTNLSTGDNLQYDWDFDNDGFVDCFTPNCNFIFFFPGVYKSTLKVSNCGGDSVFSKIVRVIDPQSAPDAEFEADVRRPVAGFDNVTFSDIIKPNAINTKGCIDYWNWSISPTTFSPVSGFPGGRNPVIVFDSTGCYDITLVAGFNGYTDTITKSCYINAITYCIPVVDNTHPDIGISRIQIGSIDNTTTVGVNYYTDYSNTHSTYLDILAKYPITLKRNSTFNTMNRKVWIDFNIDGDFEDPGELVAQETEALTLYWTDSIYIPQTVLKGATRMRIGTNLGNMSNNPCGPNDYGEFEDYRVILRNDATPPALTLLGDDTIYIEQCANIYNISNYSDSVKAYDNVDGNLSNQVIDTCNLDYTIVGTYFHRYSTTDSRFNTGTVERVLIVTQDTIPPVISLFGNLVDSIDVYNQYVDPGDTTYDTCSGVNIVSVIGKVDNSHIGLYSLLYTAYDNAGNFASASRKVYVVDRVDPTLILIGPDTMFLEVHDTYIDPWVSVSDNYWKLDPQLNVTVTGSVNNSVLGDYVLIYSITDSSGNGPVTIQRVVRVIDVESPIIQSIVYQGDTIYDGDTLKIEVHNYYVMPILNILDNYYTTFDIDSTGNFYTTFPDGKATMLGIFNVLYLITDGSFNSTIIEFIIKVVDTQKPIITIIGDQYINLCRFQRLDDDSVFVTDNYDNNLVVDRAGSSYYEEYLLHYKADYYSIVYNVTDISGNKADEVQRTIFVKKCDWYSIDNDPEEHISLYPNPNNGQFIIDIKLPKAQDIFISFYNSLGDVLQTMKIQNTLEGSYEVDLFDISSGMYFARIQTDSGSILRRITVVK